jgi:hypothetical protein
MVETAKEAGPELWEKGAGGMGHQVGPRQPWDG